MLGSLCVSITLSANVYCVFFFFKQKTAYELRISDWSSDVCSSDLVAGTPATAVLELAEESLIDLVPIAGPEVDKLLADVPFFTRQTLPAEDRKRVVEGTSVSVRVDHGGCRIITTQNNKQ